MPLAPLLHPRPDGDLDLAADRPRPGLNSRRWRGATSFSGDKDSARGRGLPHLLGVGRLSRSSAASTRSRACASGSTSRASTTPTRRSTVRSRVRRRPACSRSRARAQMQSIRRTKPENLEDLTVQVALARRGPIQGGAVHPRERERLRADPSFKAARMPPVPRAALRETLGVIRLPGPGARSRDAVRRLWRRRGGGPSPRDEPQASDAAMRSTRSASSTARSARALRAERTFQQVRAFSGLASPKAHAAAFGLLAYQKPMGFIRPVLCSTRTAARDRGPCPCNQPERGRVPGRGARLSGA